MPTPTTLSLDKIVNVVVSVSPLAAPRNGFNQALIIGSSTVIPALERLRFYSGTDDMLTDGFTNSSPEYLAAQIYFSQSPAPTQLWVGRQDLTVPETKLEAVQACRLANSQWYPVFVCGAAKADHLAIAAYIETATPASTYFGVTSDADVPTATAGNVLLTLKGLLYTRTFIQYSTSTPYAICGAMGYAMGQNTGLNGSAFTLKFKNEVGVAVEPLTATQVLNIEGANGNLYLNYGYYYNIFEQGVSSAGRFFDEVLNLDMLANNIQLNIMDTLYQNPKVPQTDAGVLQLIRACNSACDVAVNIGFLAPGVWTGLPVLNLATDQTLPKGYLVQAPPISTQTQADREARKSPPLYIAIKEAGAIHSVVIGVYVNR